MNCLYLAPLSDMRTTFLKQNYYALLAGVLLIGAGYLLMIGGGSDDPNVFNPEIFDFRRITLAPMVCLAGFVTIIVAIMWRPKVSPAEKKS
jgi:hypothetical protein